jgi:phosphoserine phosphatase RsbU/P
MQHFEPDAMATVLYAVIEPGLDWMHLCLAGHFPPVIAYSGRPAELASVASGLSMGIADPAQRPVSTVRIPPGTLRCFHTDGLIERRGELIDDGLARLSGGNGAARGGCVRRGDAGAGRQRASPRRHRPADGPTPASNGG